MDEKMYDYWLYSIPGIGKRTFLKLQRQGLTGQNLYQNKEKNLPEFLSERQKASIIKEYQKTEEVLQKSYEKLKKSGIFITVFGDDDYPKKLLKIPDPPAMLFYKGRLPKKEKCVAIIGARNCSAYGRYVAELFASYLAKRNVAVISGMANGIDGFAQRAALSEGGYSIGVLGSGVQECYPPENMDLYKDLIQRGCILSEYLPYDKASANFFPPRNRIISGLCDALIVVEAKEKSGTLITVEMALEQGKEVFVIPGRITDELSRGCNKLLMEGAYPAVSPSQIVEVLYGGEEHSCQSENPEGLSSVFDQQPNRTKISRNKIQNHILSFLELTPVHINVLQDRTGLPMEILCRELLLMTLDGSVLQSSSSWYQKASI